MFKRGYKITGFTPQLAANWGRNFREDLELFIDRKTGEIFGKIALTRFQAIVMKHKMKKYNLTHPCVLKLERIKNRGRRFRV